MRLHIVHNTTFRYQLPARSSTNELRLSPEDNDRQTPQDLKFTVNPLASLAESRDLFGNLIHQFEIEEKHPVLSISAESIVETSSNWQPLPEVFHQPVDQISQLNDDRLRDFLTDSECVQRNPETWREALDVQATSDNSWSDTLWQLSKHVFNSCQYCEQHLHVMRTATEVQRERSGTCQDFSHLLISYLRHLKIPARYCSGYLYDPGLDHSDHPELVGTGTTHAWVEAYLPDFGWLGIDPTNNCWVNEQYVSLAFGRDYHDVVPIRGSFLGGGTNRELEVSIQVKKLG